MPALMSLNANKIYLDYHLGNEIQYICRVDKNKHLIRLIWNLYLNFADLQAPTNIEMSAGNVRLINQCMELYISYYIVTAVSGKLLKEGINFGHLTLI